MSRVQSTNWQPERGTVTLYGENGEEIDVPLLALKPLADQAARFLSAKSEPVAGSDFLSVSAMSVQTIDVRPIQTTSGEKVALLMDRLQTTEFAIQIDPSIALELSEEIRSVAERASGGPPRKQ